MSFQFIDPLRQRYCAAKICQQRIQNVKDYLFAVLKGLNYYLTNSVTTLIERTQIRKYKEEYERLLERCNLLDQKCQHIVDIKDLQLQSYIWETCSKWIYERMA